MSEAEGAKSSPSTVMPGRRRFLGNSAVAMGGATVISLLLFAGLGKAGAAPNILLRPPGALPEADFAAACVRCGLCVRGCPYGTLKLLPGNAGLASGTPHFDARSVPCEMCSDIPCLAACPTAALDPGLRSIEAARMGIAEVVNREECLSLQGMHCDACYRACPIKGEAITMEIRYGDHGRRVFVPTVHSARCTGCGKCEHACVPDVAAIRVVPLAAAKAGLLRGQWPEGRPGHVAAAVRPPAAATGKD